MGMLRGAKRSIAGTFLTLLAMAGAAAALSACNTARGFGEDMSAAGSAVANSADRIKNGE